MATVSVTDNNLRADDMNATTNVTSINGGAGAGAEPDFVYQGTNSVSRKIGTAQGGFFTDTGAARDLTATDRNTVMFKVIATNSNALELLAATNAGLILRIGSDASNYYEYDVEGSDTYPIKGGWLIRPIDPNVASHRTSTTGSPTLTACDYFAILGDFTATSKGENLAMDAVDIGAGLHLVGGDSTDPDGVWQDFVDDDEGDTATTTGRYGYIYTVAADPSSGDSIIMECYGMFWIGKTSAGTTTATVFNDTGRTILFPDGRFAAGFSGVSVDLGNATTDVDFSNTTFRGLGTSTGEDTRPVLTVTGTAGVLDILNCVFDNFADLTLTSGVTLDTCSVVNSEGIVQSSATIDGCIFSGATTADGVAFITSNAPNLISNCEFTFSDGHAIEITAAGTYTFTGNKFTGYGANGTNDAAIYNNSGGAVTINVAGGGDTPTVRNGAGASTTVNNNVNVTFSGMRDNSEVRVYAAGTSTELDGIENATTGSADNRSFTASVAASTSVDYVIHSVLYENIRVEGFTWPTTDTTLPIQQRFDRNNNNP